MRVGLAASPNRQLRCEVLQDVWPQTTLDMSRPEQTGRSTCESSCMDKIRATERS